MDLFLVVKNEYSDFTILGICTEEELAEVLAAENREGPYSDARVVKVAANTQLNITTASI